VDSKTFVRMKNHENPHTQRAVADALLGELTTADFVAASKTGAALPWRGSGVAVRGAGAAGRADKAISHFTDRNFSTREWPPLRVRSNPL